jgi:hypothetical protein
MAHAAVTFGAAMAAGAGVLAGTAGAVVGGWMAVGAAAIGGFAGSVASQVVGKALGAVDHFSLRQAVGAGITAGITAGIGTTGVIGEIAGGSKIAAGAITGVTSSLAGYAGNRIAGVENTHFSWKSVAASAVTSAITTGIGRGLEQSKTFSGMNQVVKDFTSGMIGGVVSLHVRRAFGFDDKIDYGQIAADAFGNAIANGIVRVGGGGHFWNGSPPPFAKKEATTTPGGFSVLNWILSNGESFDTTTPTTGTENSGSSVLNWTSSEGGSFGSGDSAFAGSSASTAASVTSNVPMPPKPPDSLLIGASSHWSPLEGTREWVSETPAVVVTGVGHRDTEYMSRWYYAHMYGAPSPDAGISDRDLHGLYQKQVNWHNAQVRGPGVDVPGWGRMTLQDYYARSDLNFGADSLRAYLKNRYGTGEMHHEEGEEGEELISEEAKLSGVAGSGVVEYAAEHDAHLVKSAGNVAGAKTLGRIATVARVGGGLFDAAPGGYEMVTAKNAGDFGHGSVNLAIGGLAALEIIGWPVALTWGGLDCAIQETNGDYIIQYGPEAGKKVNGGWSGLYHEGSDHHETQIREIMTQYHITDRQEAQNFWFSTHVK